MGESSGALIPGTSRVILRGVVGRRRPHLCSIADKLLILMVFLSPNPSSSCVSGEDHDWTYGVDWTTSYYLYLIYVLKVMQKEAVAPVQLLMKRYWLVIGWEDDLVGGHVSDYMLR